MLDEKFASPAYEATRVWEPAVRLWARVTRLAWADSELRRVSIEPGVPNSVFDCPSARSGRPSELKSALLMAIGLSVGIRLSRRIQCAGAVIEQHCKTACAIPL